MQVEGNPPQEGFCDCGVFAGIQAEVFCTYAQGEVSISGQGPNREVSCQGTRPLFLTQASDWFMQTDVATLRAMAQAAMLYEWRKQNPADRCGLMETWWTESCKWLDKYMPRLQYKDSNLWCAA